MSQRTIDINLPVLFQKGAGFFLAAPITQFQNNFGEIFSATRNTCQTNSILRGGGVENFTNPRSNLQNALDQLEQRLTALATTSKDKSDISENICKLRSLVTKLYDIFPNVMSIVNVASPGKNKILTMNFAGYEDWDHYSVNKNEHQQLISQFLTGTGKNPQYFSKDLMVLINNDGYPSSGRSLTAQENEITQGLLKFFNENNYPHSFFEGTETREFIFDSNYSAGKNKRDQYRNSFRIIHYIQSLFTAIMLMYIDESAQNRRTIFDNFQHLLTDLQHRRSFRKTNQQDSVDFLIQEITKNTSLLHEVEDKAIKCLAYSIYMQLEMCEHVTQIEFVKFSRQHRRLADGFFQGENYFFVPISSLLMTYRSSLKLAENDSIFEFLDRIEKFSPQFETNELMIDEFKVGMQNLTQIDLRNAFIKIKSLFAENSEIFNSFDKETQDLIRANRFKTVSDIQKATDEEFKLIPIEKLSSFNHPEEQYKIFFAPSSGNGRHGRYKVITKFQLEIIHPDAISRIFWNHEAIDESGLNYFVSQNILYFKPEQLREIGFRCLNPQNIQALLFNRLPDILPTQLLAVDLKTLPEKILHKVLSERFGDFKSDKFIGLDFKLLNEPERILILENHMDVVSAEQIQTLNLKMLNESKPELLSRLLDCKRNCFSPDQLRYLILIDITYLTMISGLSEESNRGFIKYFATPELFPLTKSILDDMPKELRLIYFICYQNFIPEDLTSEFAFVISAVFQKPNEYSPDLLLDLITKCPQDLIASLIKDIDINEFPKVHLPVLFNRYLPVLATCKKLDEFSINSLGAITNSDDRLYILDVLLDHYISVEQTDNIQSIPFDVLNNQEIKLILNKACKHLISDQVKKISLSSLNEKDFKLLLDKHGNCIVLDQIQDLDFSDSMIASYIIEKTKLVPNLTIKQIQAINLSEIGEGAVKKLINAKQVIPNAESIEIYKNLTDDQVTQIDLKLVSSENRTGFMEKHARLFTTHQIQTLNFNQDHSFKMPPIRIRILGSLKDAGKLIFLNEDQITQLDIFNPKYKNVKEMFLNDFLQVPSFVKICTHGQCEIINDDTILSLNLDSVVPEFRACVYEKSFDRFSTVKQVAIIKKLAGENDDYSKIDRIKEKISSMNLAQVEKIDEKVFAILITKYIGNLSLIQLSSIDWHRSPKGKMWAQKRFCELLNLDFFDQKPYLLGKQQPTQEKLRSWPNEFKVAILNTNFLHGNFEFVEPGMRQYFLEPIRFMFAHVQNYLEAVAHILLTIDDWTNQTQEKNDLIRNLSPEYFSIAAHNQKERSKFLGIIKKYGPVFSNEQFSAIQFFTDKDLINLFASDERILFNLPNKIFFKVFIERMSSVKPESIRKIDVKGSAESPLIFEIKIDETHSITKEITDEQLKSIPPAIMKTFEPALLTKILDIKPKIFTPDQIQAIEIKSELDSDGFPITYDKYAPIAAILLLNRAKDLTPKQIQNIDFWYTHYDKPTNVRAEIKKRSQYDDDALVLLGDAHRFGDLSDNQLNKYIGFGYTPYIKEILFSHLENRIKPQLIGKVNGKTDIETKLNLPKLKQNLTPDEYSRMIKAWGKMFSNEQIGLISLEENDFGDEVLMNLLVSDEKIFFNLNGPMFLSVMGAKSKPLSPKINVKVTSNTPITFTLKVDETNSITKTISDAQLKLIPCEIFEAFDPDLLTNILDVKSQIFTKQQIQAIEIKAKINSYGIPITDKRYMPIATILLANRIEDMTKKQIQNIDLQQPFFIIQIRDGKKVELNVFDLLRKAHRFSDLSVSQLNLFMPFDDNECIKEILISNLESNITTALQDNTKTFFTRRTKLQRELNLPALKKFLEPQLYLKMLKAWIKMFSDEQIGLIELAENDFTDKELLKALSFEPRFLSQFLSQSKPNIFLNILAVNLSKIKGVSWKQINSEIQIDFDLNINGVTVNRKISLDEIKYIPCEIIKILPPDLLTVILKIKVNDFTKDQIQAIEIKSKLDSYGTPITDDKYAPIAAILLLHRAKDLTQTQIQSIDLWGMRGDQVVNVNAEVKKRNKDKDRLILLRDAHRFGDLSDNQLNKCIVFGNTSYVKEILNSHLENRIKPQLIRKVNGKTAIEEWLNLPKLKKDLEAEQYLRMVKAWTPMFSNEQISSIELAEKDLDNDLINLFASEERIFFNLPNKIFFTVFIERMANLNPEWLQKIDVKGSAESPLIFEIKIDETHSITKEITDEQLKSIPPAIMKTFEPALLTKILDIKPKIFTPDQIQAIEIKSKLNSNGTPITDDKYAPISAILLLNRAEDMTPNQIQNIDLFEVRSGKVVNVYAEVEKRNSTSPRMLLLEAHRFDILSDDQLNQCLDFSRSAVVKEIFDYHLESRITPQLQEKLKWNGETNIELYLSLPTMKRSLLPEQYLRMVKTWTPMFSDKQINSIELDEDDLNDKDLIDLFASEERIFFNLPSKIFFKVFIEHMANLNPEWLQKIEIAGSTESPLIFEIKIDETHSITKEITDEQLKSIPPEIMKTFEPALLTKILDIKSKVFAPNQIQAIEIKSEKDLNNLPITDDKYAPISAILLLNRAEDMTPNQIQSIDLVENNDNAMNIYNEIVKRNKNKTPISLLRESHRFGDLTNNQLNHIPFSSDNVQEILNYDLEDRINISLCEMNLRRNLNLPQLKNYLQTNRNKYLYVIEKWTPMFSNEQINSIELDEGDLNNKALIDLFSSEERILFNLPSKIFFKVFIEHMANLNPEWLQKIEIAGSTESPLIFEIKIDETHSITKEITDEQLKSIPPEIMKTFEPGLITKILDIKSKVFTPAQIQAIEIKSEMDQNNLPITDNEYSQIAAILILNRANDITPNQIKNMDLLTKRKGIDPKVHQEIIARNENENAISLLRKAHRFCDLSVEQLNQCIDFGNQDDIKELIACDLLGRITLQLQEPTKIFAETKIERQLNLPLLKGNLESQQYLLMIKEWSGMFKFEQLMSCIMELDIKDINGLLNLRHNNLLEREIITGILLYKYCCQPQITCNEIKKSVEAYVDFDIRYGLYFFNCIMLATEHVNSHSMEGKILFHEIAKKFFEAFDFWELLNSQNKFSEEFFTFANHTLTPDEFGFFIWEMGVNCPDDRKNEFLNRLKLVAEYHFFGGTYPSDYRNVLQRIKFKDVQLNNGSITKELVFAK